MKSARGYSLVLFALIIATSSSGLVGQVPQPAPVPSDFAKAQTAFLASAGAPSLDAKEKIVVQMMYEGLYRQLTSWKRYKLVDSLANADLAFELSLGTVVSGTSNGTSYLMPFMKLDVRDVHTHVLLWTIDEPVRGAFREKTFRKNIDDTVTLVMEDLKELAAGQQPGSKTDLTNSTQP